MSAVREALHKAVRRQNLEESEAAAAMEEILGGEASPTLIGSLLIALAMKGETVDEIVGFARTMRRYATPVPPPSAKPASLIDTCGTGGDGLHSFNISTVTAFVVAGAGVPVAKHGNRSISSRCGSADVLEGLGANVQLAPDQVTACIEETGIGFLFAPLIHPAMKHAQPARTELKLRTIFNMLGPLTNPAGAAAQVVGVFEERLVDMLAEGLHRLGIQHAFVVHGSDGLDEITTTGPTLVAEVNASGVIERQVSPRDFGLPEARPEDLHGGSREDNVAILHAILEGEPGSKRDIVVANAAAALVAAGRAADFRAGARQAAESLDAGRARTKLDQFIQFTKRFPATA